MKKCRTCGRERHLRCFWKQKSAKSGYQSECRDCMKIRNTSWHRNNLVAVRARNAVNTNRSRFHNFEKFLLRGVRQRARLFGHEFDLTITDIVIPDRCPVLDIPLVINAGLSRGHGMKDHSPSVDRVDNSKGYTRDNILIVSFRANRLKSNATPQELRRLADFYEGRFGSGSQQTAARGLCAVSVHRQQDVPVSGMQPHKTKQTRQMSLGFI